MIRAGRAAWKQTIAYPFEQMRRLARGEILHVVARSDRYDSSTYTDVPIVDVSATYDAEAGRAALFLVNCSLDEAADLTADLSRMGASAVINATTLHARGQQDRHATNLNDHAAVIPHAFRTYALAEGILQAALPPLSWTVLAPPGAGWAWCAVFGSANLLP